MGLSTSARGLDAVLSYLDRPHRALPPRRVCLAVWVPIGGSGGPVGHRRSERYRTPAGPRVCESPFPICPKFPSAAEKNRRAVYTKTVCESWKRASTCHREIHRPTETSRVDRRASPS